MAHQQLRPLFDLTQFRRGDGPLEINAPAGIISCLGMIDDAHLLCVEASVPVTLTVYTVPILRTRTGHPEEKR